MAGAVATSAVLALALGLSACGSTGSGVTTAAGDSGAVLKWATTDFPSDWDPVVNGAGAANFVREIKEQIEKFRIPSEKAAAND